MISTGLHQQTQELAILIDEVLISLKAPQYSAEHSCQTLGNLLLELSDNSWNSMSSRLLAMLLTQAALPQAQWRALGESICQKEKLPTTIRLLEKLARSLEQDEQEVYARTGR
jgi:hypothetical protein